MNGENDIIHPPGCEDLEGMRETLLAWYDRNARELPWRGERDPYRIWLSEIMLQQTRVDTVMPYYNRFLEDYPRMEDLIEASEEEVLKRWEGLGYYARARNFLSAVREVGVKYGGEVPDDPRDFRQLPGVGEYTAAAVLSIAYGIPLAAVDANIRRVIRRLFCLEGGSGSSGLEKGIKKKAGELLDHNRAGDFNQALMDLGATLCTQVRPGCDNCPLVLYCRAYEQDKINQVTTRKKSKPLPLEEIQALVIVRQGKHLVRKRPPRGLLGGMWELPTIRPGILAREQVSLGRQMAVLEHQFSHLRWRVFVSRGELLGESHLQAPWRWVAREELSALPFPAVYHPIIKHLQQSP